MNIFTAVKYCCILHGRVFVMPSVTRDVDRLDRCGWNEVHVLDHSFCTMDLNVLLLFDDEIIILTPTIFPKFGIIS